MILKLKRTPGIYLVGFMGSGKTTVGRMLAREIGWSFVDLDQEIEAEQGRTIADIFEQDGEEEFRRIESEALQKRVKKIRHGRPCVVALGGGAFTRPENVELLADNGVSVWLDCDWDIVQQRVSHSNHRPLARDPLKMEALFQQRRTMYAKADFTVPVRENDSQSAMREVMRLTTGTP